jgi:phosphoglucomutase
MSNTTHLTDDVLHRVNDWLSDAVDADTRKEVEALRADPNALLEAFYSDLEFGTGGLRGVMGVGSMRMNRYTVGMATQGLANYLNQSFGTGAAAVAIACDSRNQSPYFAHVAASVLSANGIRVYIFPELRPTPLLSFAVRELKCQAGIVVTASHNPPEYNGYKVYWEDGAQVLPPHDKGIIAEVRKVQSIGDVKYIAREELITPIGPEVEESYLRALHTVIHSNDAIRQATDLKIVYTSIHGAGITMIPRALKELGFHHISVVKEQEEPNGDFPTVKSPNPEEKEALALALAQAEREGADMVMGTDPDTDRVGIAIRNAEGELVLLNGNQAASLIVYYELLMWQQKGLLNGKQYIAKTIVTTDLLEEIARSFGVKWYDTLTGFKYIAGVMREREGKETFIAGGEESYGYLVGEFVRDKDAVLSGVVLCEIAAWCRAQGRSMWDLLMEIYQHYGIYHEALVSITMKGLDGLKQIQEKMVQLRRQPPAMLGGVAVARIDDVQACTSTTLPGGEVKALSTPSSNVLQFILTDGSKVSARPSGTEPKIKFYFSLKTPFTTPNEYSALVKNMESRIAAIRSDLGV